MTFEKYKIPEGYIMIAHSDHNLSMGILEIDPNKELSKHNRPVLESLYQIKGKCVMGISNNSAEFDKTVLKEGQSLDIPKQTFHIHSNPFQEKSITLWRANGDITKIINNIRKNSRM